jgi:long-subunit acyl-CoA synthetase (AMP-forming)
MKTSIAIAFLASMSAACSFVARDTDTYKNDTRTVLESKNSAVVACYDSALAANPSQSGNVVVTFVVEKKTGAITNVSADPNQSTAPEALQNCVVTALEGLTLDPADQREGQATFTWTFTAPSGGGKPAA